MKPEDGTRIASYRVCVHENISDPMPVDNAKELCKRATIAGLEAHIVVRVYIRNTLQPGYPKDLVFDGFSKWIPKQGLKWNRFRWTEDA